MKEDLISIIEDFVQEEFLDYGSNATDISFIPKMAGVTRISDYRPISLVGSVYKIISKLLVDWLKLVLPLVFNEPLLVEGKFLMVSRLLMNVSIPSLKKGQAEFCAS